MSRASGRRGTAPVRKVESEEITPDSPEGRDIGLSDRTLGTPSPIPGGEQHLLNHQTMRQPVPTTLPRPEFRGTMAHGVPAGTHSAHERADAMRGPNTAHDPKPVLPKHRAPDPVPPVPVIVVEDGRGIRSLRSSSHRRYALPLAGTEPIRLCGRNSDRVQILLLNEDDATGGRFAQSIADLISPDSGSLLPSAMGSYLRLTTQDELYAVSEAPDMSPYVSIIEVFDKGQSEVQ